MLLLKTAFCLNVLLLKLGDKIVLKLNLLQTLIVLRVGLGSLDTVLLFIFLELVNQLLEFLSLSLVASNLILKFLQFALESLNGVALLALLFLGHDHVLIQEITLAHLGLDVLLVVVNLSAEVLVLLVDQE